MVDIQRGKMISLAFKGIAKLVIFIINKVHNFIMYNIAMLSLNQQRKMETKRKIQRMKDRDIMKELS
jgi:hypothetical protein